MIIRSPPLSVDSALRLTMWGFTLYTLGQASAERPVSSQSYRSGGLSLSIEKDTMSDSSSEHVQGASKNPLFSIPFPDDGDLDTHAAMLPVPVRAALFLHAAERHAPSHSLISSRHIVRNAEDAEEAEEANLCEDRAISLYPDTEKYAARNKKGQCDKPKGMWMSSSTVPATMRKYGVVADLFGLGIGSKVLDWGAGCGTHLDKLAGERAFGTAVAIDLIKENADWGTKNLKHLTQFCAADGASPLPFPNNTFDAVLSNAALYHIPVEAQCKVVKDVLRILRTGGSAWFGWLGPKSNKNPVPMNYWKGPESCLNEIIHATAAVVNEKSFFGTTEYDEPQTFSLLVTKLADSHTRQQLSTFSSSLFKRADLKFLADVKTSPACKASPSLPWGILPSVQTAELPQFSCPLHPDLRGDQSYYERARSNQCNDARGMWRQSDLMAGENKCKHLSVAKLLGMKEGSTVFDWGAGCGHELAYMQKEYGILAYGAELVPSNVEWMMQHTAPMAMCGGDASNLSYIPNDSFDHVITNGALLHLKPADQCNLIKDHLLRILAPGGTMWAGWSGVIAHGALPFTQLDWKTCLDGLAVRHHMVNEVELFGTTEYADGYGKSGKDAFSVFVQKSLF